MLNKIGFYIALIIILPLLIWLAYERPHPGSQSYPPYDLTAISNPIDTIGSITLNWHILAGDSVNAPSFPDYKIYRSDSQNGPFNEIGIVPHSAPYATILTRQFMDTTVAVGSSYYYKVNCSIDGSPVESNIAGPVSYSKPTQAMAGVRGETIIFPPTQLRAFDSPNDEGHSITLEWKISPNDTPKSLKFRGYDIYRAANPDGPFEIISDATGGETDPGRHMKILNDGNNVGDGVNYYYYVAAKWNGQIAKSNIAGPAQVQRPMVPYRSSGIIDSFGHTDRDNIILYQSGEIGQRAIHSQNRRSGSCR